MSNRVRSRGPPLRFGSGEGTNFIKSFFLTFISPQTPPIFFFFSISHYAAPPSLPYFPRYIMRLREELPYSLYFHHISLRARKNTCKPSSYLCLRSPKIMTSVTLSIHCCSIFNLIRLPVSSKGRKSILLFSHFHRFLNYEPFV